MPWKATDAMKERTKFVLEWERRWHEGEGVVNMSELCRMFGVSRQSGYKWVARFRAADNKLTGMTERSRRPKSSPNALDVEIEDLIVEARKRWPKWGPRKLRARVVELNPGKFVPSASAIAKVLKRRGLTVPRKRRRNSRAPVGITGPFSNCEAPNAVWCIDFKGWFLTGDGRRCYPLTLIDAYSRYLLRCEALVEPDGSQVMHILDSAFQEFGIPVAIRSDGGPPFASTGPAKLTDLSVWLLQLGIRIEIIAPGKPQQNGRLERLHRTLKAETASPPRRDVRAQQRAFDPWRREYNFERPHEALKQRRPSTVYVSSSRRYPRPFVKTRIDPFNTLARIDKNGFIKWQQRNVFISSALYTQTIEIEVIDDRYWNVKWGEIVLGRLDDEHPEHGLIVPHRRRGSAKVTTMSLI